MRPISHCLNNQLIEICQQVVQLEELDGKLRHFLPSPIAEQCCIGSFNKGCLVIIVNDANWATELRYLIPGLRDQFRAEAGLYQLSSIKIAIAKPKQLIKPPKILKLSKAAREAILQAGEDCSYLPLKNALNNLAEY